MNEIRERILADLMTEVHEGNLKLEDIVRLDLATAVLAVPTIKRLYQQPEPIIIGLAG